MSLLLCGSGGPGLAFSPNAILPDLWLSGDTLGVNGSAIATWTDQSAHANNASQATGALRPVVATNVVNGKSVARFTAASLHFLNLASVLTTASPQLLTVFAVHQTSGDGCFMGATGKQIRVGQSGGNTLSGFDTTNNPVSSALSAARTAWNIVEYVNVGSGSADMAFFEAGTARGTAVGLNAAASYSEIGATNAGATLNLNGDLAEYVVWLRVLSSGERAQVRAYLSTKYAIAAV